MNKNFPLKDYKSFVGELRKSSKKHSYTSSGASYICRLAMELFLIETGALPSTAQRSESPSREKKTFENSTSFSINMHLHNYV